MGAKLKCKEKAISTAIVLKQAYPETNLQNPKKSKYDIPNTMVNIWHELKQGKLAFGVKRLSARSTCIVILLNPTLDSRNISEILFERTKIILQIETTSILLLNDFNKFRK
jgi:hypothetical protein